MNTIKVTFVISIVVLSTASFAQADNTITTLPKTTSVLLAQEEAGSKQPTNVSPFVPMRQLNITNQSNIRSSKSDLEYDEEALRKGQKPNATHAGVRDGRVFLVGDDKK